ncbi:hypothetical protein NQ317_019730 [Molorchus minor]|uniref:Uncharacterized protein n=1 Tax=Molorchus minor TaxID=1323400 RepID=A0ABQ9IYW8_9CUCU|nr:hypothetical protein NQ317_019730 [Molorchus minor]
MGSCLMRAYLHVSGRAQNRWWWGSLVTSELDIRSYLISIELPFFALRFESIVSRGLEGDRKFTKKTQQPNDKAATALGGRTVWVDLQVQPNRVKLVLMQSSESSYASFSSVSTSSSSYLSSLSSSSSLSVRSSKGSILSTFPKHEFSSQKNLGQILPSFADVDADVRTGSLRKFAVAGSCDQVIRSIR